MQQNVAAMFMCDAAKMISVYAYTQRMAARAYPNDVEAAADIASECFDIFVRNHIDDLGDYHAWIGRSVSGLKKNRDRELRRRTSLDDGEMVFDRLANLSPQQEPSYDAKVLRRLSCRLNERERWAFDIIADGGNIKDIIDEMYVGPREALALYHQMKLKMASDATITQSKWRELVGTALAQAGEAGTDTTTKIGVAEGEHAVPKGCAQKTV
jgi:hypothetical protein